MDGNLSGGDLGLAAGDGEYSVLVDDAGGHDFGVCDFVSYELGFDKIWDQGADVMAAPRSLKLRGVGNGSGGW